jgi:hypothetical protein
MATTYQEGSVPSLVRALCRKLLRQASPKELSDEPSDALGPLPGEQKLLRQAFSILLDLSPQVCHASSRSSGFYLGSLLGLFGINVQELYPTISTDEERKQHNLLSTGQVAVHQCYEPPGEHDG